MRVILGITCLRRCARVVLPAEVGLESPIIKTSLPVCEVVSMSIQKVHGRKEAAAQDCVIFKQFAVLVVHSCDNNLHMLLLL